MRIGFSGYYGMANYGDDLFAITAFLASQKYWEKFDPLLLCRRISNFKANYGIAPFIPHGALANLELTGKFCRLTNLLWNSFNLDKIVFAGGSLFHSGGISARDFVFLLKRGRRDYFSAIGVSIGPFEDMSSERRVCKKLRSFEYISVRDRVSYERLMSYDIEGKVVQAADLVGVLPEFLQRKKDGEGEVQLPGNGYKIGFSPCFLPDLPNEALFYCDCFISFASRLSVGGVDIKIICLNQHGVVGDVGLCKYVENELSKKGIFSDIIYYQDKGALGTWKLISELDAYFSVRLHGAITAYLTGTSFFLFEYHEKCTEFLDFIGKSSTERVSGKDALAGDFDTAFERVVAQGSQCEMSPFEFSALSLKSFLESPFL